MYYKFIDGGKICELRPPTVDEIIRIWLFTYLLSKWHTKSLKLQQW